MATKPVQQPFGIVYFTIISNYNILQNKECNACGISKTNQGGI